MVQQDQYFLGHSLAEQERLQRQALELAPESNQLFDRIGVGGGCRAVEVGCGPLGCLEILSQRVGPKGSVVGVEMSADAVALVSQQNDRFRWRLNNPRIRPLDGLVLGAPGYLSSRPREEPPRRLVLRAPPFEGLKFYKLARVIAQVETAISTLSGNENEQIEGNGRAVQLKRFKRYRALLKVCGLKYSVKSAERTLKLLQRLTPPSYRNLQSGLQDLHNHIHEELEETKLWRVERPEFLDRDGLQLGQKFRLAHKDAVEAGKCLALGRNTAGVFHLMRVMEIGLRELGDSINDPSLDPKTNPTWEKILGRCDKELAKPYKERSSEWAADGPFFSTATANLRAVKDAWRNPTLHVERFYDEEEARDVWNAARAFMRHLALKLG